VVVATDHLGLLPVLIGLACDLGSIAPIHMQAGVEVVGQGACDSAAARETGTRLRGRYKAEAAGVEGDTCWGSGDWDVDALMHDNSGTKSAQPPLPLKHSHS
jgi:hypothetical protein